VHSTQFRRDPEGVADPAPLTAAAPQPETHAALLSEYERREAARRALVIRLGFDLHETTAEQLIATCRSWAEEEIAKPDRCQRDMYPYFAGCLQAVLVDVCERLNEAQTRPADFRARLAHQRRIAGMEREAKKHARGAQ